MAAQGHGGSSLRESPQEPRVSPPDGRQTGAGHGRHCALPGDLLLAWPRWAPASGSPAGRGQARAGARSGELSATRRAIYWPPVARGLLSWRRPATGGSNDEIVHWRPTAVASSWRRDMGRPRAGRMLGQRY